MNYLQKRTSLWVLGLLSLSCVLNTNAYAVAETEVSRSVATQNLAQIPSPSGTPEVPGVPSTPTVPGASGVPGVPSTPGVPSLPGTPSVPGVPGATGVPTSIPGVPSTPGVPSLPGTPSIPSVPGASGVPSIPGTPSVPSLPGTPSIPSVPGTPGVPGNLEVQRNLPSIGQIAMQGGVFNTLLAALEAAEISDILDSNGPLTLFAPIDSAFEALPAGALDMLLKPQNQDLLLDVLANHILDTQVVSSDLSTGTVRTMGGDVSLNVSSGNVRVNDARVLRADVQGRNGVIHVIDQVLVPEAVIQALSDRASASSSSSRSNSASSSSTTTSSSSSSTTEAVVVPTRPTAPSRPTAPAARPAPPVRGLW